ncbi:MAG: hypothetical protein QM737_22515 [Ferruginibacter sp.]
MKNLLVISLFTLFITSCKKDHTESTATSPFVGNWTGTYIGTSDEGGIIMSISSTGSITGTVSSQATGATYGFNGSVSSTGQMQASSGTGADTGTFTGTLSGNSGNGTWQSNAVPPSGSGTWACTRQ